MRLSSRVTLLALSALLTSLAASADPRLTLGPESPAWLRAVGRLEVPGVRVEEGRRRNYIEDCSATLVARPEYAQADLLVSAWHCLADYGDLTRTIRFSLVGVDGQRIERTARPLDVGGRMRDDWALLRLSAPVARNDVPAITVRRSAVDAGQTLIMAGYSGDAERGAGGTVLSYDPACHLTRYELGLAHSDCHAYKGASGGAVIQLTAQGQAQLAGVISAGDSEGISVYLPVVRFLGTLDRHLPAHRGLSEAP